MTEQPPASTSGESPIDGLSRDLGLRKGATAFGLVFALIGLFMLVDLATAPGYSIGAGSGRLLLITSISFTWGAHVGAVQGPSITAISGGAIPQILYYLAPIAVLVWSGRRVATAATVQTPKQATMAGLSVVGGYVICVVATIFVWTFLTASVGIGASPTGEFSRVMIVAGLVYPVVFGAIGGFSTKMDESPLGSGTQQRAGGQQGGQEASRDHSQGPVCQECGASNTHGARYCTECNTALQASG